MLLASSNININALCKGITSSYSTALGIEEFKKEKLMSEAWYSKMEQAYQKARILLKDDVSFMQIENLYNTKKKEIKNNKVLSMIFSPWTVIIIIILFYFFFGFILPFLQLYK